MARPKSLAWGEKATNARIPERASIVSDSSAPVLATDSATGTRTVVRHTAASEYVGSPVAVSGSRCQPSLARTATSGIARPIRSTPALRPN